MSKVVEDLDKRTAKDQRADGPVPAIPANDENEKLLRKLQERRHHWEWNLKLLTISIVVAIGVSSAAYLSYQHHSVATAETFMSRAVSAQERDDFKGQLKWLKRYSMLEPDDVDAIRSGALSADAAADRAERSERFAAVNTARKELNSAVARLGDLEADESDIRDLRGRLIERLLQLGGNWYREAERQVTRLNADPNDPEAAKWLALSLFGQVQAEIFEERDAEYANNKELNYWERISFLPPGEVLAIAVEKNPQDLDLIAAYLTAFATRPETFNQQVDSLDRHQQRIDDLVVSLRIREDSRSMLILYLFAKEQDRIAEGIDLLIQFAPLAERRLTALSLEDLDQFGSSEEQPEFVADYQLLAEAAFRLSPQDYETASRWYECLFRIQSELIPIETAEMVFTMAGQLHATNGNEVRAIETWERGLQQVNTNSLPLLGAVAIYRSQDESDTKAEDAVTNYRSAISAASSRLAADTERDLSVRTEFGNEIATAQWRLTVADGLLAARDGRSNEAMRHFDNAMRSTAEVSNQEKRIVALRLARLAQAEDSWDRVATALDVAVELDPGDEAVRIQAANAWTRAGHRLRAIEHWRILSGSESIPVQIASVEALLQYQSRLAPSLRDFSGVRSAIRRIDSALKPFLKDDLVESSEQLEGALIRLDVIKASLPAPGTSLEKHLESTKFANATSEIAARYNDDPYIIAFAAERLATAENREESVKLVDRLAELIGPESSPVAIIRARLDAIDGKPEAASSRMIRQAERDPKRQRELLLLAMSFALDAQDVESAYAALQRIPSDRRLVIDKFNLARLARVLPENSEWLMQDRQPITNDELSQKWEREVKLSEGSGGAHWLFLQATRILDALRNSPNEVERNDPRIAQIRRLARSILVTRPRWGEAISIEGWLLALEGRHELAIEHLRRGIAAGDMRLPTQMLLVQQLIAAGRGEEAEQQLNLTAYASESPIDEYAQTRIAIAAGQGDMERSLSIAQAQVDKRPDDYLTQLVLARTALTAAQRAPEKQRQELHVLAGQAAERAAQLAANEPAVYATLIRLFVTTQDESGLKDLISRIRSSKLNEYEKEVLQAKSFTGLEDYETAEAHLRRADRLKPTSESQLMLAALYQLMGDSAREIASLRAAQQLSPERSDLRLQLAQVLAARDGKNVNWDELASLLRDEKSATSRSRLAHAMLLGTHGNAKQQSDAAGMLRDLIREGNAPSVDAARTLAALLRKRLDQTAESEETTLGKRWISEIRSTYDSLISRPSPNPTDLYRYADFLLALDHESEHLKVRRLIETLENLPGGTFAALDLRMRVARLSSDDPAAIDLVEQWTNKNLQTDNQLGNDAVAATASVLLMQHGFVDESIGWLSQAYEMNPELLRTYVALLKSADRIEEALRTCVQHYEQFEDVEPAILLADLLANSDIPISQRYESLLQDALSRFDTNVALIETAATLRLLREQFEEAITLFRSVRKLDPFSVRALNNLAMALAQVPGREAEAIEPIEQAIKLSGEVPELLDTKGFVLFQLNKFDEALATYQRAAEESNEPRYQFHIVVTLLAQDRLLEAKRAWSSLDLERLDPQGLTPQERKVLEKLKREMDGKSGSQSATNLFSLHDRQINSSLSTTTSFSTY